MAEMMLSEKADENTRGGAAVTSKAYILIETGIGRTNYALKALQKILGVQSVDAVTGPYDIIAVVEGDDLNAIGSLVTGKIHPIGGITRTVTCLAIRVA
ncbi:MAG: Lrp/AsnC ligand binding domain-containing protein [Chloroflexota bacterium]